ncbi:Ribonuclease H2 subunit A [Wickerhamomyces ciferrii]|uniref:Ribonuclease n=1 Tax=Wickerhamomyces ciferrii (strain ATCC 14091 / BCRC 22168 / CBS 111 / JCM 3599 / NBRC 0793 / NRRL Y-1031 F-60-10) TaxID=1206466 RepID=K0KK05_WICCF|nr:Ribonuclease H2 subunit A [Wickerhamomyces ciferrii]CCH42502.1 Ribonuclease H2 subunit A [Wickerhamomyces ciferrii]
MSAAAAVEEPIEIEDYEPETIVETSQPQPEIQQDFLPPSVPREHTYKSTTFLTPIPKVILENPKEPCVLGVDEAGRGPVLGPMVYGISYCLKNYESILKSKYGFADSKTLNELKRTNLLKQICDQEGELFEQIGWSTRTMTAMDISSGMLRPPSVGNYNLNEQAHDATMDLIQGVLDQGVNLTEIFVDTVGPPVTYQAKLQKRFPNLKIIVAKKADSIYPIVSAASICAKVTRDFSLNNSKDQLYGSEITWGSGYPSDPNTKKWLNNAVDPIFGWDQVVRFSWQTAKDAIIKNDGIEIEWEEDNEKDDYGDVGKLFRDKASQGDGLDGLPISTLWYGRNVNCF